MPDISLVIPCRNEYKFIDKCLKQCLNQKYLVEGIEIIVADGQSSDGTLEILEKYAKQYPQIKVIDNPEKITPTALNRAIKVATGNIIIRIDVHTEYADNYVYQCIIALNSSKADNVGGPWLAAGNTYFQKAIAMAFQSPFSSGGALSHNDSFEGYVDSVYLGCWKKLTLQEIGLFDEELVRNQDDELNYRIIQKGGKIWQTPHIKSTYYPRSSIIALFKQYRQYGYWKIKVIQKHKIPASISQIVPGLFIAILFLFGFMGFFSGFAKTTFAYLLYSYSCVLIIASILTVIKEMKLKYLPVLPMIYAAFHFGYGFGFLQGIIDMMLLSKSGRKSLAELTR